MLERLLHGDRRALAKAITLVESTAPRDRRAADELLTAVLPHTGRALRLGISGVPGAGKSTFIETFGLAAIARGAKVAVLAIDPSSTLSGGSILGDKTRMERLSVHPSAFVRPTPSAGTLGGVASRTREVLLLCEAAGYDLVIVETVGVGQSETTVAGMTDLFVLLQLPNAGDELQAIKRGVLEVADVIVVNKADLDPDAAARAARQLQAASKSHAPVPLISALSGAGVPELLDALHAVAAERNADGRHAQRRREQSVAWLREALQAGLLASFHADPVVGATFPTILRDVEAGVLPASAAARQLLAQFLRRDPT